MDITNDEAYSFHNMKEFWYAEFLCTGNSHWLNSAFMWICIKLHLTSVFWLRLLSLFAGCTFVGVMASFSYERTKEWNFGLPLFILTCCNPYVLDYFILARGYSAGILLQALSLFFLFRKNREEKHFFFSILAACGSALAHFSFAYYLIAFLPIFWIQYSHAKRANKKLVLFSLGMITITLTLIFLAIRFMSKCSNDYIGAGAVTLKESLISTTLSFLYSGNWSTLPLYVFGITTGVVLIVTVVHGLFFNKAPKGIYFANSLILFLMLLSILIAKYGMGHVFPSERSALFLFFPATINFVFFIESAAVLKKIRLLIFSVVSLFFLLHFMNSVNLSSMRDYKGQAGSKKVFEKLKEVGAKNVLVCGEMYGVYKNYYSLLDEGYDFKVDKLEDKKGSEGYEYLVLYPLYILNCKSGKELKLEEGEK